MKIQIASDLHFEFDNGAICNPKIDVNTNADVLVIAGDSFVVNSSSYKESVNMINQISESYDHVIMILGNHEFYNSNMSVYPIMAMKDIRKILNNSSPFRKNVKILDNESAVINGVRFVGSTLWTDCNHRNPIDIMNISNALNDFKVIFEDAFSYRNFTVEASIKEFDAAVNYLEDILDTSNEVNVVVTHHAPSHLSVDSKYKGNKINCAFASDLEDFIEFMIPKLWIHGHMHNSCDYEIGNTRIVCNPYGYIGHEENPNFNPSLVIEV